MNKKYKLAFIFVVGSVFAAIITMMAWPRKKFTEVKRRPC